MKVKRIVMNIAGASPSEAERSWLNRYGRQQPCEDQCKDLNEFVLKVLKT